MQLAEWGRDFPGFESIVEGVEIDDDGEMHVRVFPVGFTG
jgi:hypothetical protein